MFSFKINLFLAGLLLTSSTFAFTNPYSRPVPIQGYRLDFDKKKISIDILANAFSTCDSELLIKSVAGQANTLVAVHKYRELTYMCVHGFPFTGEEYKTKTIEASFEDLQITADTASKIKVCNTVAPKMAFKEGDIFKDKFSQQELNVLETNCHFPLNMGGPLSKKSLGAKLSLAQSIYNETGAIFDPILDAKLMIDPVHQLKSLDLYVPETNDLLDLPGLKNLWLTPRGGGDEPNLPISKGTTLSEITQLHDLEFLYFGRSPFFEFKSDFLNHFPKLKKSVLLGGND